MSLLRCALHLLPTAMAALALGGAAQADLGYEEIIQALPGTWEVDRERWPVYDGGTRCDQNPLAIDIREEEKELVFEADYVGVPASGFHSTISAHASGLHLMLENDPGGSTGQQAEFFLHMPDEHHYGMRRDPAQQASMMFRRCPEGPVS